MREHDFFVVRILDPMRIQFLCIIRYSLLPHCLQNDISRYDITQHKISFRSKFGQSPNPHRYLPIS